ncbi:probable glutamate receptor, partial [Stegodyphus dumicola]|uniref:probable glutamate receptor n=1 Tax=Stegodyphus dumicola TaxID=202533 RepID=UPI0015A81850
MAVQPVQPPVWLSNLLSKVRGGNNESVPDVTKNCYPDNNSWYYSTNDILMSIFDKGISSIILEISEETSDSILNITEKWKLLGVKHILFMHYENSKLLALWSKILQTICDDIWWLFFDENDVHYQLLEMWGLESSCTAMGWILLNKSCVLQSYSTDDATNVDNTNNQEMALNSSVIRRQNHSLKTSINDERRRKKSKPKLVRLALDESPPYLTLNMSTDGEIGLLSGPEAELLRTLQQKFGFEYKLMKSPDGEWGRIKNGSWTGLIGMVTRKEADMASGCVSVTSQRFGACGFSYPFDIQKSVIISKTPEEKPKTYAVLLPFPVQVWLLMLLSLLVYLLLFYFTGRVYQTIYLRQSYSIESLFWYLYGTICAEGGKLTSIIQGPSAVLLLILWLLFVLVMQASYCGTLMSVLTFPWSEPSINTLHDLAQAVVKKGYKCGCRKGTINCDTMLELQGDLKVIAESLSSDRRNFVRSVREGLDRVLEGNFAFLAQQIGSVYEAQTMPSPYFSMSGEGLDIELFSLAVRDDFQFLEGINEV